MDRQTDMVKELYCCESSLTARHSMTSVLNKEHFYWERGALEIWNIPSFRLFSSLFSILLQHSCQAEEHTWVNTERFLSHTPSAQMKNPQRSEAAASSLFILSVSALLGLAISADPSHSGPLSDQTTKYLLRTLPSILYLLETLRIMLNPSARLNFTPSSPQEFQPLCVSENMSGPPYLVMKFPRVSN